MDAFTVAVGIVGFLTGQVLTYAIKRGMTECDRRFDLAIDVVTSLGAIEDALKDLNHETDERLTRETIASFPARLYCNPPVHRPEALLPHISDIPLHRLVILFFDRLDAFREQNTEHLDLYERVLDADEKPADANVESAKPTSAKESAAVIERVDRLKGLRKHLRANLHAALAHGYEILQSLIKGDLDGNSPILGVAKLLRREGNIHTFLERTYDLHSTEIDARAAAAKKASATK